MTRLAKPLGIAFAAIGAVSLFVAFPQPVRAAVCLVQYFFFPGAAFLLVAGRPDPFSRDGAVFSLVLSPVVASLLIVSLYPLAGSVGTATTASVGIVDAAILIALLRRPRLPKAAPSGRVPAAVLWVSAGFAALIAAACLASDYLLVRSDAWHHASIVREILDRGLPPMEPRFTDLPIRYMWFYHLFQAGWTELSGLALFPALAFSNVVSAFAFPYLVAHISSLFTRERRALIVTPLLSIAGLGAASWILWPVALGRALTGDVRGADAVGDLFASETWNRADAVIQVITPYGSYLANVIHKYLTITAINCSANLMLLAFALFVDRDFHRSGRFRPALTVMLVVLGTFLFHIITGTVLVLTVVAATIFLYLMSRWKGKPATDIFPGIIFPVAAILAALLAMPYFRSLTRGGAGTSLFGDYMHIGLPNLLTIALPLAVLLPFSLAALRRLFTEREWAWRALAAWVVPLFGISLFVNLPGMAERKFVSYLFLFLTLPVAWELLGRLTRATGRRKALLVAWIVVLFVPQPLLTLRGFVLDRPIETFRVKRYRISPEEARVFDWIAAQTPPGSVIIERNTYNLMPVRSRRRSFFPDPGVIDINGFGGEKVERYAAIRQNIFADKPVRPEAVAYLRALDFEFYVVVWEEDVAAAPWLAAKFAQTPEWFEPVMENSAATVFHLTRQ